MNFRIIKTVIAREYLTRVKKKSFLITTFLVPILFAGIFVIIFLIMGSTKERSQKVAVVDQSGFVMPYLESTDRITYLDFSKNDPDSLKNQLEQFGMDVMVRISPLDTVKKTVSVQSYSKDPVGVDFSTGLSDRVENAVEDYRIQQYGIENLKQIMQDVKCDVKVTEYTIDEKGNESISESGIYMMISLFLGIIIYMFIAMFGGQVMSSVIEEKTSRVVEVLISSVKSVDLMFGKIIGVALVALTQFLMWIVLTGFLLGVAGSAFGKDMLQNFTAGSESVTQVTGMSPEQMQSLGIPSVQDAMEAEADTSAAAAGQPDELTVIINTLSNVPWVKLIIAFLIYFILGYLLYSSFFAAIGSTVENEGDAQQLLLPVTVPLMIAYFVILIAFQNPDSGLVVWCSMIPFTSPIVMLARIPYGVPDWQLILSILLLFLTFLACAWLSAKIYRAGILMFGKKTTFKDLWKWLKQ
ncbi:MAG: ABC transporter permease [Candidatus Cryptobacteroides sp.]|jgi:ABC-2 type transport system permease protein|nr:ABC transporter permease [Bacteroidota bacterium]NLN99107.1 ABC transporter permease [Bacteroidales bacterium]